MKKKSLSDSIATLEETLAEAERTGNKRAANCARMILKKLKKPQIKGLSTKVCK
jgi:hypothetical protein